jgi:aminoglycoside phosphotransferase (APT) family kinase protein
MRERWTRTTPVLLVGWQEAADLIRPALGAVAIRGVEAMAGGHSNTNLHIELEQAPYAVVLRLYQRDPAQARKEAAISALVAATVPVPRYLHLGERASNGQTYALVEWVEGETLAAMAKRAGDAEMDAMGGAVGAVLAAIHAHTFDQAGLLDGDLKITPFPGGASLTAYLEMSFQGIAGERIGRRLADAVVALARRNEGRQDVWNHPPRLTHFDFGGTNILMRNSQTVSGVVDWEFAASAAPSADFGNLLRPPLGKNASFVRGVERGYRAAGGQLPDDWLGLTRLADMGAWAEFLTRPKVGPQIIDDARKVLSEMTAATS